MMKWTQNMDWLLIYYLNCYYHGVVSLKASNAMQPLLMYCAFLVLVLIIPDSSTQKFNDVVHKDHRQVRIRIKIHKKAYILINVIRDDM
jgi:hypothetical protein